MDVCNEKLNDGEMEEELMDEGWDGEKSPLWTDTSLSRRSPHWFMSAKAVTLPMLIQDGIIEPGEKMLSMEYMGQRFIGDLLPSGKIRWPVSEEVFNSPSAFAIHCKQMVNPAKKSGCGWSSVKYKGKKLDAYKSVWFSQKRAHMNSKPVVTQSGCLNRDKGTMTSELKYTHKSPVPSLSMDMSLGLTESGKTDMIENTQPAHCSTPVTHMKSSASTRTQQAHSTPNTNGVHLKRVLIKTDDSGQDEALNLCIRPSKHETEKNIENKPEKMNSSENRNNYGNQMDRNRNDANTENKEKWNGNARRKKVVKYSSLGKRSAEHDQSKLVECITFNSISKTQPFRASISSNCFLVIDFHCHLTTSEVVGYLAGRWDPSNFTLQILQAFPCRCQLDDKEKALVVEQKIREKMESRGLSLVGWYHSHPYSVATPSLRDIDSQLDYQFKLTTRNNFNPCMGLIASSYLTGNQGTESTFQGFWVLPSVEQKRTDYGIPMQINFSTIQDNVLTADVYAELKHLVEYYRRQKDFVDFLDQWEPSWTYLDKLKCSLSNKFPKDQSDGKILEFIDDLLVSP